jgi:hypothetical protein
MAKRHRPLASQKRKRPWSAFIEQGRPPPGGAKIAMTARRFSAACQVHMPVIKQG